MDGTLQGSTPAEDILWYTRWFGAIPAHATHMGGTVKSPLYFTQQMFEIDEIIYSMGPVLH